MNKTLTLFFILFLLLVSSKDELYAYPRFAAYTGDKCMDCHVNPTGGVMRNKAGIEGAKKFLNMELFKKINDKVDFSPEITKDITVGGDVRIAQIDDEIPAQSNMNTFLSMQGDFYVNAKLNKILSVMVTSGIQIPNIPTKYEVFGMLSNLPANGWFKAGRFTPNFGIRIPEHRAFQRLILLNAPYTQLDGFEIGVSPSFFNLSAAIFNGLNTDFFDGDAKKMVVASTDFTFSAKDYNYNFNFGGSFYNNPYNKFDAATNSFINANKKAFGGFTKIGILKRVALLGEVDLSESSDQNTGIVRGLIGYGELNVRIIQGVELRGVFEYYDPNRDIVDDETKRYSAGFAFFPFFGFETETMVRIVKEEPEVDNNEFQWSFHFYF